MNPGHPASQAVFDLPVRLLTFKELSWVGDLSLPPPLAFSPQSNPAVPLGQASDVSSLPQSLRLWCPRHPACPAPLPFAFAALTSLPTSPAALGSGLWCTCPCGRRSLTHLWRIRLPSWSQRWPEAAATLLCQGVCSTGHWPCSLGRPQAALGA